MAVITRESNITSGQTAPNLVIDTVPTMPTMTAVYTFHTKSDGAIEETLKLPTTWNTGTGDELWYNGEYYLYIYSKMGSLETIFKHRLKDNTKSLIPSVNSATDDADIEGLLTEFKNRFAVSSSYTPECIEKIAETLYQAKRTPYSDDYAGAELLLHDYMLSEAVGRLKSGADVCDIIDEYRSYFGVGGAEWDEFDKKYTDAVKNGIGVYLKNANYTAPKNADNSYTGETAAGKIYEDACMFSEVRYSADWTALKTAVIKYEGASKLSLDKETYFKKVVNKDDVYSDMWDNRAVNINNADDVKAAFEKSAKAVYESENPPSNPLSGGGGGGGAVKPDRDEISVAPELVEDMREGILPSVNTGVTDIDGHWAKSYIANLQARGVVSGYEDNTYKPDNLVTRAEYIKLIVSALGLKPKTAVGFSDVSESDWHSIYVGAAYEFGLVTGDENGSFNPNDYITRQDAAVITYRAIMNSIANVTPSGSEFGDYNEIADYARIPIISMQKAGVITGMKNGNYVPLGNTTRAEAAAMVVRSIYR